MSSQERGTIHATFVREALVAASKRAVDTNVLLRKAGTAPALLVTPGARVTPQMYGSLWKLIAEELDDEFLGLDSHGMRCGSYALLCDAVITSTALAHVLSRTVRFLNMVLDDFRATFELTDEHDEIRLEDRSATPRLFSSGTYPLIIHGLGSWLTKRRLPILRTSFQAPVPPEFNEYLTLFGPHLTFDADVTALAYDASLMQLPVKQTPSALKLFLQDAPTSFLLKYKDNRSASAVVRRLISKSAPAAWPRFDDLTAQLGVSPATLRRRLENEGRPYQAVKDELRRDMAMHLLETGSLSVAEVACCVGFTETSAFHRAFRKWTGLAPGEFRQNSRSGFRT
ncbi:AraC family transcriptional regulator [Paraburkholderia sp.]|uniref:AraC family transcriptional regulator n=1 Tax=Paraburkholderia sp. TaxID=1926495 RepID=UPI003D6F6ADC